MISGVRKAYEKGRPVLQTANKTGWVCGVDQDPVRSEACSSDNPESGSDMTILDPDPVLGQVILTPLSMVKQIHTRRFGCGNL